MRKALTLFTLLLVCLLPAEAQVFILDSLAFQDFEVSPAPPVWNYAGSPAFNSGLSAAGAAPPSSPLGIGGSRAWESTSTGGGLILTFNSISIPPSYDSLRLHFNCAAFNLIGSTGGPDNTDNMLVELSTDGGATWYARMRIRGAVNDNSFWGYDALGFGKVDYLPMTEVVFQPILSGLATTLGYSNLEIVFPGTVTQVALRMTGRSNSTSDTWMVDNVVLTGEKTCSHTAAAISVSVCDSFVSPSGGVYFASGVVEDTIPNVEGCDSVITFTVTVNSATSDTIVQSACGSYLWPVSGLTYTSSGIYQDTLTNASGCDSLLTLDLTISSTTYSSLSDTVCNSYTTPSGAIITASGVYLDSIPNAAGCDSIITLNLEILGNTIEENRTTCGGYVWPQNGVFYTSSGSYYDTVPSPSGCDTLYILNLSIVSVDTSVTRIGDTLVANMPGALYQWVNCDSGFAYIPGATSQSFLPSVTGNYAVQVTNVPCVAFSSCRLVIRPVGVDDPGQGLEIPLWPNPNTGSFIINLPSGIEHATLDVVDLNGRLVHSSVLIGSGEKPFQLQLSKGLYLVRLTHDTHQQSWRMLVE